MRKDEIETLAHSMGRLEGLVTGIHETVAGINSTVAAHVSEDTDRFTRIIDKLDKIDERRHADAQAVMERERALSRWRWSTIWAFTGTGFGALAGVGGTLLKFYLEQPR